MTAPRPRTTFVLDLIGALDARGRLGLAHLVAFDHGVLLADMLARNPPTPASAHARAMLWSILHETWKLSIAELAKMFSCPEALVSGALTRLAAEAPELSPDVAPSRTRARSTAGEGAARSDVDALLACLPADGSAVLWQSVLELAGVAPRRAGPVLALLCLDGRVEPERVGGHTWLRRRREDRA